MPFLTLDVLVDVAKELVKSGDQEAVYKFALCGKLPLQAMKSTLASVTTLKIDVDDYVAGWGDKCTTFDYRSAKPHAKFMLDLMGNHVTNLHIDNVRLFQQNYFQQVFEKISHQHKLISFSTERYWGKSILDNFLLLFVDTLKHLTMDSKDMTKRFRDGGFNLITLTAYSPEFAMLPLFCCKTVSLELPKMQGATVLLGMLNSLTSKNFKISVHLSTIKDIIFTENTWYEDNLFFGLMQYFTSLEKITLNIDPSIFCLKIFNKINTNIPAFINESTNVPSKIICKFLPCGIQYTPVLSKKIVSEGYELLGIFDGARVFSKSVESAGPILTIVEIHLMKQ